MKGEPCIRKKRLIDGENYYIVIGETFLDVTVPRENKPEQSKVRNALEEICATVNEVRGGNTE